MERKVIKSRNQHVFRRDNWTCQMPVCLHPEEDGGRAIDPNLYRKYSRWEPTVDHIIPKSLGGSGKAENLRAAHRACNEARGNGRRVVEPKVEQLTAEEMPGHQGGRVLEDGTRFDKS